MNIEQTLELITERKLGVNVYTHLWSKDNPYHVVLTFSSDGSRIEAKGEGETLKLAFILAWKRIEKLAYSGLKEAMIPQLTASVNKEG